MGVDTRSVCMVGVYFEDFDSALEYLVENEVISEESAEDARDWGQLPDELGIKYHSISCYSEEGGYLGVQVSLSNSFRTLEAIVDKVQQKLGEGVEVGVHNFVYWY